MLFNQYIYLSIASEFLVKRVLLLGVFCIWYRWTKNIPNRYKKLVFDNIWNLFISPFTEPRHNVFIPRRNCYERFSLSNKCQNFKNECDNFTLVLCSHWFFGRLVLFFTFPSFEMFLLLCIVPTLVLSNVNFNQWTRFIQR